FSPQTQRSLGNLESAEVMGTHFGRQGDRETRRQGDRETGRQGDIDRGHFCDYLPREAWTVLVEPGELEEQGKHYLERVTDPRSLFSVPGVFQQLLRFPNMHVS